jgi:hypothetical protein
VIGAGYRCDIGRAGLIGKAWCLGGGGWLVVGLLGVEWNGGGEFEASLLNGVPNSEVQE